MKRILLTLSIAPLSLWSQTVLVQPYVQPGDGARLSGTDVKVLTWVTDTTPGEFSVQFEVAGLPSRTARVEVTRLDFPKYSPAARPPSPLGETIAPAPLPAAPHSKPSAAPALSLEELKQSTTQSFSAIPEREQHYLRYRAVLEDLPFDASVTWSVHQSGKLVRTAVVKTRSSAERPIRFAAVGDMASNRPEAFRVAHQISASKPDFLIALGDIVYPGGRALQYFNHFFPVYNDVAQAGPQTGAPIMATVPIYPVLGNHDTEQQKLPTYPDAYSCFFWFSVPRNGPGLGPWNAPLGKDEAVASGFRRMAGPEYPSMHFYSFDSGPGHFLILDANKYALDAIDKVLPWIEKDLKNSLQKWKVVCFHQPAFHSSREHYSEQRMRLLQPIFERFGVDLVLAGHVHNYQRSHPLRFTPGLAGRDSRGRVNGEFSLDTTFDGSTHTRPNGVIHIVSGGGGARLYSVDSNKNTDYIQQESPENYQPLTAKIITDHGFTLFEMSKESLELQQINMEGRPVDRIRITK
jgi:predicted phosphodiesterase